MDRGISAVLTWKYMANIPEPASSSMASPLLEAALISVVDGIWPLNSPWCCSNATSRSLSAVITRSAISFSRLN